MDTAQWPQEIMVKPMEDHHHHIISNTCSSSVTAPASNTNNSNNNNNNNNNNKSPSTSLERKIRPQKDQAVNCPRCNSTNTKFCYYNNYSLTQPRYFCKTCRRYWTEGGSLRNIPVGGGSRKNKRSSSSLSSPSSSSASKRVSSHDLVAAAQSHHLNSNPNHKLLTHQGQDLNLGFPPTQHHHQDFRSLSEYIHLPIMETHPNQKGQLPNSTATTTTTDASTTNVDHHQQHQNQHHLSALELLNGLTSSRGLTSFMPMAVPDPNNGVYSSGYPSLQDFKPSLNFSLDGLGSGYGSLQGGVQVQQGDVASNGGGGGGGGRLLFPFEDLKQVSNNTNDNNNGGDHNDNNNNSNRDEQDRDDHGDSTTGYWSGMLNSGGSW